MITAKAKRPTNGTSPPPEIVRVAVYTRQSVADDLEFNSLEAQRQAVEAYVQSQGSKGWQASPDRYDDHGFSGGTMERPAFKRLLKDVEAGLVQVVAVHRLDRLSRSINDFVRVLELLEQHGANLVSTTQSFDTSTSLGRMTVNLLATFATYERDMIRERTQEKMSATRRRGLYVGGVPPLGYDLKDKKLVVNEGEAQVVREIFTLYLGGSSLLGVAQELNARGLTTKARPGSVRQAGSKAYDKHAIRRILANATYAGKVEYKGAIYDGQHEAIVDQTIWEAARRQLESCRKPTCGRPCISGALLAGLVRCACGASMSVQSSRKGSRRYTYYACSKYMKQGAAACPGSRVATREIESFVLERIKEIGKDPTVVRETIEAARRVLVSRRPEIESELVRLCKEREGRDKERKRLVTAVGKGKASPAILERLGALDLEVGQLDEQVTKLEEEMATLEAATIDEADLQGALAAFTPTWEQLSTAEKARAMQLLVQSVEIDAKAGDVGITFRPGGVRALAEGQEAQT